ncbi:MAG: HAMP domain-containing histidine kinase, partial [Chitinophagaceae bacterium]
AAIKGQHIGHRLTEANVYANRSELVRVVSNLLANAIKFSPFGSGIFVSMQLTDQGVEVVVRDHGAGVSQEKRKTIFDMDSGPGELGTDGEKSFGIGLSISKKILRAYNGKIGFRDAEGEGTEFFFVLPLL